MLTGFTASLLLVTIAELGDKTFFVPMILAMRHPRRWVWLGAVAALALMTILGVVVGKLLQQLPEDLTRYGAIALFVFFGLKLLRQAGKMSSQAKGQDEEEKEALQLIEQAEAHGAGKGGALAVVGEAFSLTFLAEWGDKTQIATVTLAAAHSPLGVMAGAILGHSIAVALATIGGRMLAAHISERTVTWIGGGLFLLFALLTAWEGG